MRPMNETASASTIVSPKLSRCAARRSSSPRPIAAGRVQAAHHHDRLCHLRHRLRRRGGHRWRTAAKRDAGRASRRPRPAVCDVERHFAEAARQPGRPMRPDIARLRLLRRSRRPSRLPSLAIRSAISAMAGRSRKNSADRAFLARSGHGRRIPLRGDDGPHQESGRRRQSPHHGRGSARRRCARPNSRSRR